METTNNQRDVVNAAFDAAKTGTVSTVKTADGKTLIVVIVNALKTGDPRSNGHNWVQEHFSTEMIKRMQEKDHPEFWSSIMAMFDKSKNFGVYLIEVQLDGSQLVVCEAEWNLLSDYIVCIETNQPTSPFALELWNLHMTAIEIYKSRESYKSGRAAHCAGLATASDYRGAGAATESRLLSLDEMKKAGYIEAFGECTGKGSLTVFTEKVAKMYRVEVLKQIPYIFGPADVQFAVLVVYLV